jgi:hypothetical protein
MSRWSCNQGITLKTTFKRSMSETGFFANDQRFFGTYLIRPLVFRDATL